MTVSKRLRHEVMRRDNFACRYCGGTAPDVKLTLDHVTPTALGGGDDPSNLVTACADCNAGKSATPPDAALVEDVAQDALRWLDAQSVVIAARSAKAEQELAYADIFYGEWTQWRFRNGDEFPLPTDWRDSLAKFYAVGLPSSEMRRAVDKACGNSKVQKYDTFRYFCGICWRVMDDINKATADVLRAQEADDGA